MPYRWMYNNFYVSDTFHNCEKELVLPRDLTSMTVYVIALHLQAKCCCIILGTHLKPLNFNFN